MEFNMGATSAISRRRSRRLPLAVPLLVSCIEPTKEFSETCETIWVSAHGCSIRSPKTLEPGDIVRLDIPHSDRKTRARVVHVQGMGDACEIGLELDKAENFWGVSFPPEDWCPAEEQAPAPAAPAAKPSTPEPTAKPPAAAAPPQSPAAQPKLASAPSTPLAQLELRLEQKAASLATQFEQSQREVLNRLLNEVRAELYATTKREWERTLAEAQRNSQKLVTDMQQRVSQELTERLEALTPLVEEVRQTKTYLQSLVKTMSEQMEAQRQQWANLQASSKASPPITREVAEAELRSLGGNWLEEMRKQLATEYTERRLEFYANLEGQVREARQQIAAQLEQAQRINAHLENFSASLPASLEKQLAQGLAQVLEPTRAQLEAQLAETQAARLRGLEERIEQAVAAALQAQREQLRAHEEHLAEFVRGTEATLRERREQLLAESFAPLRQELDQQLQRFLDERVRSQEERLLERSAHLVAQAQELTAAFEQRQQTIAAEWETRLRQQWQAQAESLLAGLEQRIQQASGLVADLETRGAQLAHQADKAALNSDEQLRRFETSIHDALVEATGQIRGRIQFALENAQAPLEERARMAQKRLEETSGRVVEGLQQASSELEARLRAVETEVEQSLHERCQQSVARALDFFESKVNEVTERTSRNLESKFEDTLESIARVLRDKLGQP